jgi:hypothetical protein
MVADDAVDSILGVGVGVHIEVTEKAYDPFVWPTEKAYDPFVWPPVCLAPFAWPRPANLPSHSLAQFRSYAVPIADTPLTKSTSSGPGGT